MKTRTGKRPIEVSTSDDDDLPISSLPSKPPKQRPTKTPEPSGPSSRLRQSKGKKPKVSRSPHSSSSDSEDLPSPVSLSASPKLGKFFRNKRFESRFNSSIISKTLVFEKSVDLFLIQHSALQNLFESSGIATMLIPPDYAYPQLVRQFYANFEFKNGICSSFVNGRSFELTDKLLGSILSVSYKGSCPFTLKGPINEPLSTLTQLQIVMEDPTLTEIVLPSAVDVPPLALVLHKILRFNLLPRTGGGSNFTFQDLILIAMILEGKSFNFALLMLNHMDSCIKQRKKCLPFGGFLTKVFQYFHISLDSEASVQLTDSVNADYLKSSNVFLVNGSFIRTARDLPASSTPSVLPPSSSSSTPPNSELVSLLNQVLAGQQSIKSDIVDIKQRLAELEKGKKPMIVPDDMAAAWYRKLEDEFIDIQAGFELQTGALVEAMQRKMNRNAVQLSQEVKFVSSQIGTFSNYMDTQTNALRRVFDLQVVRSNVPDWVRCNWLAEYQGDFLDLPLPPPTHVARPPRFANTLSAEERAHRRLHRRYFSNRPQPAIVIEDID